MPACREQAEETQAAWPIPGCVMEKTERGEQFMSAKTSRNHSRIKPLHLLAGLVVTGLSVPTLLGQSVPFPTYKVGPQTNGTFVASDGTILTPAGTQVSLGIRVRVKAVALNPTGNHTAAVLAQLPRLAEQDPLFAWG